MKIDTEIRHTTPPGANIFLEIGFPEEEATRLLAESDRKIDHAADLKRQMMAELAKWVKEERLTQAKAAEVLRVSRPRVSDIVNQKTSKFTVDTLIQMLLRLGKPVKLVVG